MAPQIPKTARRSSFIAPSLADFLNRNSDLHLGGEADFHQERRHHLEVLGFHALPENKKAPIGRVEFEGVRGPRGTIPIRLFYPKAITVEGYDEDKSVAALVYMHGSGYTVGSVDDFENGLRLVAEAADVIVSLPSSKIQYRRRKIANNSQTIGVDYRLAPEHRFPTQLDEFSAVIDWAQGPEGLSRGISPDLVFGWRKHDRRTRSTPSRSGSQKHGWTNLIVPRSTNSVRHTSGRREQHRRKFVFGLQRYLQFCRPLPSQITARKDISTEPSVCKPRHAKSREFAGRSSARRSIHVRLGSAEGCRSRVWK
jgi:alpha/beta hydrolase fold